MANSEWFLLIVAMAVVRNYALSREANTTSYLQTYPEVNADSKNEHLYFALTMSFGGQYDSSSGVIGVQVALDQINNESSMLPGYTLHYTLTDSQCDRNMAFDSFFEQVTVPPAKVALLGSGCSVATEPTAEVSHFYNMVQISCESTSAQLADRRSFRKYFQMLVTDDVHAIGFFSIIQRYGWRQVVILQQNENLFTTTTDLLTSMLDEVNVTYTIRTFETEEGIEGLGDNPFGIRHGVQYPQYHIMTLGWYSVDWWKEDNPGCTIEDREKIMLYSFAVWENDVITEFNKTADTGITGNQYLDLYASHLNNSDLNISTTNEIYAQACYDAMWALALALNNTITDIENNEALNKEAARCSDLDDGVPFSIENFTYSNAVVAESMFKHFEKTDFLGVTGNVSFNSMGIRAEKNLQIYKFRVKEGVLVREQVGRVENVDNNPEFTFFPGEDDNTLWRDGLVPYDGIHIEETVTVAVPLTVIYTILAAVGIAFTVVCIGFNFIFRQQPLIRLTSPNLNYLIGLGAVILYVDTALLVIPSTNEDTISVICNITPWLTSLGYSLCFGTMLAKMARVYYIFSNPRPRKSTNLIHDWHLCLMVLALVVVDIMILSVYTIVEGVRGNLDAKWTVSKENPEDTKGELSVVYENYFYVCSSTFRDVTLSVLYGYKGVLQVTALILAFQIRKVKVKGLNDAKYIVGAVYVSSIVLAVILLSTFAFWEYVNVYPAVTGLGLLVGATAILVITFVPKMVQLYRDPQGELIFQTNPASRRSSSSTCEHCGTEGSNETIASLRRRVVELENTVSRLQSSSTSEDVLGDPKGHSQSITVTFEDDVVFDSNQVKNSE